MGNSPSAEAFKGVAKIAGEALGSALSIGGAIAGLAAGPETLPLTLPAAIGSTGALIGDITSLVKDRNFDAITGDATSNDIGKISDGVAKFAANIPTNTQDLASSARNATNILFRGSGMTPIGEIAKISAPIKNLGAMGDQFSSLTHSIQNTASMLEGKALAAAGNIIPPGLQKGNLPPTSEGGLGIFPGVPTPRLSSLSTLIAR